MAIMFYPLLAAYAELFDILNLDGNERVLDVGCGLGKMAIGIGRHLKDDNGIDVWNKIEILVDRASWKNLRGFYFTLFGFSNCWEKTSRRSAIVQTGVRINCGTFRSGPSDDRLCCEDGPRAWKQE